MTGLGVPQIAVAAGGLFAIGLVVLAGLLILPKGRGLVGELLGAAGSLFITLAVLVGVFLGGTWTVAAFFVILAARVGYEAAEVRLGRGTGRAAGAIAAGVCAAGMAGPMAAMALAGLWCLLVGRLVAVPWQADSRAKAMIEIAVFPILPLAVLANGAVDPDLRALMLAIYILIETLDAYALLVGKIFGRTKAFPVLSPRKTVEGLVGGAACLVLTAGGVAGALDLPVAMACGVALIVGVLGVAGDLGASRLKRIGGVKDFPVVLRHQGGAFDILDSWIAAGGGIAALAIFGGVL